MRTQITAAIYTVIDSYNAQNPSQEPVVKSLDTILYGSESKIDSLGLINLVVAVEQEVETAFHQTITLADDRALSQEVIPFTTVATLVSYIELLLKEKQNGSNVTV